MLKDRIKSFKDLDTMDKTVVATAAAYGVMSVALAFYGIASFINAVKK